MSFFSKLESVFKHLFHEAPTYVHYAETLVAFAAPFATALLTEFDPELAVVAGPIIQRVKANLATVSVLVGDGTNPVTLASTLDILQSNLQAVMDLTGIKNAELQNKITVTVPLIIGEIQAVQSMIPKTKV